ncbi:hypothetical protein OG217_04450 [Streptomyces sp. NBC_01023]|uniref:hypothetical protein n=1 Tax=Streptomyces sp. NBC_01023 TaxID=2903724 RepID=UPI003865C3DC|nr:hypothetical protein OG217_04450 [Streptomyces sp. NBC_01023]
MSGTVEDTGVDAQDAQDAREARDASDASDAPDEEAPGASGCARRRALVAAGLAVLLLVLGGAGMLFRAHQLRTTPAAGNHALTDTEATSQVTGDVSDTLGKVLSYTPQATDVTAQSARELLAGKAAKQYNALFGQVGKRAKEQKLTLTTQVVRAGVTRLTGSEAQLLVFLDQTAQRKGRPAGVVAAQLSVTAELRGGNWLITDITAR